MKAHESHQKTASSSDSGISNENHCQSYLSDHLSTLKKKSLFPQFLLSSKESARDSELLQELQRKNSELVATISRYNTDLDEGFFEKIALKKRISDLEVLLNESQLQLKSSLRKESRDIIVQTDFIKNQFPKYLEIGNVSPNTVREQQHQQQQQLQQHPRTPENWNKFLEYNSVKHFFVGEIEGKRTPPSPQPSQQAASDKGTPSNEMDCEYFISKRHIEKMMGNITTRVTQLRDAIKKSYPQILTPDTVVVSLNELSEQIRFLRVLIDDQLIEIRKFAEEIQDQAHSYIPTAPQANNPIFDHFNQQQQQKSERTLNEIIVLDNPNSVKKHVSPFQATHEHLENSMDNSERTTIHDNHVSQTSTRANINKEDEFTTNVVQTHLECKSIHIDKRKDISVHPIHNATLFSKAEESQYSVNLLDTLADDEFDLDSIKVSQLTNSIFNSKSNRFPQSSRTTCENRKINEIVTFSFGSNLPIAALKLQEDSFLEYKQKIAQEYEDKFLQYQLFFESLRSALLIKNTSEHHIKSDQEIISTVLNRLRRFHQIQESAAKIEKRCKDFGKDSMNSTYSLGPSFEIANLKKSLQTQLLFILNQKNLNILTIKNNMENIKRVLGKENEEISIQYEQYGIVSAEVVFIMMYCKNLLQFLDQISQELFENACTDIMDKLNADIDALQISKKMKLFTEVLKMSVEYHFLLRRTQID